MFAASPREVWHCCLVVLEPSCFLCVMWHGEAFYGLRVQGFGILFLLIN
jgi:hypothetical protein